MRHHEECLEVSAEIIHVKDKIVALLSTYQCSVADCHHVSVEKMDQRRCKGNPQHHACGLHQDAKSCNICGEKLVKISRSADYHRVLPQLIKEWKELGTLYHCLDQHCVFVIDDVGLNYLVQDAHIHLELVHNIDPWKKGYSVKQNFGKYEPFEE